MGKISDSEVKKRFMCVCLRVCRYRCWWRPINDIRFPEAKIAVGCVPHDVGAGN